MLASQKGLYLVEFVLCALVYRIKKAIVVGGGELWTILDILK